jgi:hypothetical protein
MADFQSIKQQVTIAQVIEMLGITGLTPHGETLRGFCPICKEGNNRAFVVTPARNIFYCFSEKRGGSVIDLVARFKRIPESQAGQQLAQHFGLNGAGKPADNAPAASEGPQERKAAGFDPLAYLKTLDAGHDALKDLDLQPETLIEFQAGYASKGLNRGRLAVAWHDVTGTVKAFIGVSLGGDVPHYLMPKDVPLPYWFGTHRLAEGESVRIVSDVLDVMRASEHGCTNVICPLAPTDGDALTCLKALVEEKKLTIEF